MADVLRASHTAVSEKKLKNQNWISSDFLHHSTLRSCLLHLPSNRYTRTHHWAWMQLLPWITAGRSSWPFWNYDWNKRQNSKKYLSTTWWIDMLYIHNWVDHKEWVTFALLLRLYPYFSVSVTLGTSHRKCRCFSSLLSSSFLLRSSQWLA